MFKRSLITSQKLIVTDGIPSSGKALICNLISGLPNVEQWTISYWIDQIVGLYNIKKINLDTVNYLLKTNHNQILHDTAILRHSNFRTNDVTSVTKHPRFKVMKKRLKTSEKENIEKSRKKIVLHYCTHMISNFSEPLFKSFQKKLVFIRIFRSPLNIGMLKRLAYFSKVWSRTKSRDGHIKIYDKKSKKNIHHLIYKKNKIFSKINYYEKAILILEEIINKKKIKKLNKFSKIYGSKIISIPFENLIINPEKYLKILSKILNVKLDKITKKVLKKNKVPRSINLEKEKQDGLNFIKDKVSDVYLKKIIKINTLYEKYILTL
tara:strand:+ start:917 stop:1882 length:966 start_codon:yes stop_codon:yes gene_type:complete